MSLLPVSDFMGGRGEDICVDRLPHRVTNATPWVAGSACNLCKINEVADGFGLALPVASDSVNKEIQMQQAHRTILLIALAIGLAAYFPQDSNAATLSQGATQPPLGKTTGKSRNTKSIIYKNKKYRLALLYRRRGKVTRSLSGSGVGLFSTREGLDPWDRKRGLK